MTYLVDDKQRVIQKYTYTAFGVPSVTGEDMNIYTYTGREFDRDSGMYYYRSRHYIPSAGRFDRIDDIRHGDNWYAYCNNNPLGSIDPYGYMMRTLKFKLPVANQFLIILFAELLSYFLTPQFDNSHTRM